MLPTRGSSVRRHGIGIDEIVSIHCSFSPRVVWYTHIHIQRHTQRERERERERQCIYAYCCIPGFASVRSELIERRTFDIVSAGLHCSLRMSRQMFPLLLTVGTHATDIHVHTEMKHNIHVREIKNASVECTYRCRRLAMPSIAIFTIIIDEDKRDSMQEVSFIIAVAYHCSGISSS